MGAGAGAELGSGWVVGVGKTDSFQISASASAFATETIAR